jgi:excisionase family DNA binding protein
MNDEYLTRKEVASYLKIGLNSADKIIKNRRFTGKVKVGRRILVIKSELDKFMKSQAENIYLDSSCK